MRRVAYQLGVGLLLVSAHVFGFRYPKTSSSLISDGLAQSFSVSNGFMANGIFSEMN